MLILLSPAKNLDFEVALASNKFSQPRLLPQTKTVMQELRQHSPAQLRKLMGISDQLAELNYARHQAWQAGKPKQASPAVAAFQGNAYKSLKAWEWDADTLNWAQQHLRILSGLYGLLRPLDLIQAYRLEMGSRMQVKASSVRKFWQQDVNALLAKDLKKQDQPLVINLASAEYFSVVDAKQLAATIIGVQFVKRKKGKISSPGFLVKQARGAMAGYIILNRIQRAEEAKQFTDQGYRFDAELSSENQWVFAC